jgi:hypothetical protein
MRQCKGKTKGGSRCRRHVPAGHYYCPTHASQASARDVLVTGLGAVAGAVLVPGVGGALGGAAAANLLDWLLNALDGRPPKVFVSFDFDNDQQLKHLLIGQTKRGDLPFSVVDESLKEAQPEPRWKEAARRAIRGSDLVVVLVGRSTHRARGVLAEVAMAREEGKPVVQLLSTRHERLTRVPGAGHALAWSHANLEKLFKR